MLERYRKYMPIEIMECPNNNRLPTVMCKHHFSPSEESLLNCRLARGFRPRLLVTALYGNILAQMKRTRVCSSHFPVSWPSILNLENSSHSYLMCVFLSKEILSKRDSFSQSSRHQTARAATAATTSFSPSTSSASCWSSSDSSGSGGRSFSS